MSCSERNPSSTLSQRLLDLSQEDKRKFLDSFDYVLTDCDGVVWNLYGPIEGTGQAIGALKAAGKRVVYVSNNSVRPLENYQEQIRKLGHEVTEEDLVHPAVSIVRYLKSIDFNGLIYAIGSNAFLKTLRDAGYEVLSGPDEPQPESLQVVIPVIHDKKPVKAVIVDYDFNCSHIKLLRAEMYLKCDQECLLIGGATDYRVVFTPTYTSIGTGYYTEILERSVGRKAVTLGKPGTHLVQQLKEYYGIEQDKRVLFVGDMIAHDVAFGKVAGFQTLLVLTGGSSKAELDALGDGDNVPDYYTESFADLEKVFKE
uniref:Phosphoglycolate phosphatase 2 n=1 Tax=Culex pipiens TaxID=7175 RepID=A0A8D8HH00_CULPI